MLVIVVAVLVALLGATPTGAAAGKGPDSLAPLAAPVLPAVVTITVAEPSSLDLPEDSVAEVFRNLFGELFTQERRPAVGTGVVLDAEGLTVTAAHVLSRLGDLEATTADGVRHPITIIGMDRKTDVAIFRLGGKGPFPHAVLGDSDPVRVGDTVLAIGSPYGLGATVTGGIISATARPRPIAAVDDLFQTDAATFPESAGGPLVDARGEVIGLVTVLSSQQFGITFALPSNAVRRIVAQLARDGSIVRGAIGALFQELTPHLAGALGMPGARGVIVTEVSTRGAAAAAGLHRGDVVTSLDGRTLETPYDVERVLRDSRPAQVVELAYARKGERRVARLILGREVAPTAARPFSTRSASLLSFEVRALAPEMGVVVAHVRPDRPAADLGPQPGDIVREIDQQPVRSLQDFERLVDAVKPGDWLVLLVQRGRTPVYVAVHARRTDLSAVTGSR